MQISRFPTSCFMKIMMCYYMVPKNISDLTRYHAEFSHFGRADEKFRCSLSVTQMLELIMWVHYSEAYWLALAEISFICLSLSCINRQATPDFISYNPLEFTNSYRNTIVIFQVRIARIFNTYGPRMCLDDGRVVSNFVAQVCSAFVDNLVWHTVLCNHSQELMHVQIILWILSITLYRPSGSSQWQFMAMESKHEVSNMFLTW